ncbi:MAG: sugar transferase [Piscinibacter sp.]|uniref:sugar transferase n=1 Tax=Piscinibacter sp. TaxID=1903157 RepID=UPI002585D823|nr:sugar transferase [Piscinibacter sp.]MCW5666921.1 sugar transferase [Piscinibacter sp.]
MAKRVFDVLVAALGLLLLSPLFMLIALAVKLDSPGPVFFRQERVGRHGVPFRIHKLRTMRDGAAGTPITVGDDPRITRTGRWLRATKLDELAQLIDVLVGDMSLVGPRPELPRYVALYPPALRDKVLSVRPGITDPASIEYRDESAQLARAADPEHEYVHVVLPRKLRLAEAYVEQASLATDLQVIWRTVRTVWGRAR